MAGGTDFQIPRALTLASPGGTILREKNCGAIQCNDFLLLNTPQNDMQVPQKNWV
jgi:hypothetical protein